MKFVWVVKGLPTCYRKLLQKKSQWAFVRKSVTLASLFLFFLTGCTTTYAPVEQRGTTPYSSNKSVKKKYRGKTPEYHRVKRGDTLYSIAWMYGLDYKNIAYKNRIKPPYRIFVGDKLQLSSVFSKKKAQSSKVPGIGGRYKGSSKRNTSKKRTIVAKNTTKKSTNYKSDSSRKKQAKKLKQKSKSVTSTGTKRLNWSWPVKGKIIQRYSPGSGKKGIDISATKGAYINSAEAGKVVYSGQGLVGYGRLIIIKHNDTFLSAYAHNQSLLVNEGQLVKKGQKIARLGRSGTDRYKLHFEIRKNGKPVNPLSYLPH